MKNMMNSSLFSKIILVQNSQGCEEFNQFCPPNSSEDLCLLYMPGTIRLSETFASLLFCFAARRESCPVGQDSTTHGHSSPPPHQPAAPVTLVLSPPPPLRNATLRPSLTLTTINNKARDNLYSLTDLRICIIYLDPDPYQKLGWIRIRVRIK